MDIVKGVLLNSDSFERGPPAVIYVLVESLMRAIHVSRVVLME